MTTFHLRDFRQRQGVSQAWLARKLGIHRATLARYENGITEPPPSLCYQLAHLFRYPIEEVIPKQ